MLGDTYPLGGVFLTMLYFFLFFIATLVYAFWPKNRARFEDAARMPLRED